MKITDHSECDNVSNTHDMDIVNEDTQALRCICKECKNQYVVKKDWRGVPDNVEYTKLFKRLILQRSDNLFYKAYPEWLKQ